MPIVLKTVRHIFKRKGWKSEDDIKKSLLRNMTSQLTKCVDGDSRRETSRTLNNTEQPEEDPERLHQDSGDSGQTVLSILRNVLLGDLRSQEATEQVKQWAKLNSTADGIEVYPQHWMNEYLKIVEMSVDKHFPTLPAEEPKEPQLQPSKYLELSRSSVSSKLIGLAPVLEDSGLLCLLVDSYNCRLFAVLDLLVDRSSSVKDVLFLLQWVKKTYFSHDLNGCSNINDGVLRVSDPLLVTGWFEKSKQKLLPLMQAQISTTLQNVLLYNDEYCDCNSEEDLIKVHVDVIQCLNAALQGTNLISETLKNVVQRVCCDELHCFVQRYVNAEKKHLEFKKLNETCLLHLFRITNTCRHLRTYALNIMDSNNNTDSSTLLILENMEAQVSDKIHRSFSGLAKDHLKKYFKEKDVHIHILMDMIQNMFAPLPQKEQDGDTKQHMVKAAYKSATRMYLQCLMQRKCRQLERRWGDINGRIMNDAKVFHSTFKHLNTGDDKQKTLLLKISEIMECNDVDTLKLICADLYKIFPEESEKYLPALLKWKNRLPKWQLWEILDVSTEACQNGAHRPHQWKYWSCCLYCT